MTGRQHDLHPGFRGPMPQSPVSPISTQGSLTSLRVAETARQYPGSSVSPPRKSIVVSPMKREAPPLVPPHRSHGEPSSNRKRRDSSRKPDEGESRRSQRDYEDVRDLKDDPSDLYKPIGGVQALQDIDSLFNRRMTPSPEPVLPPRRPKHRSRRSSSSVAPLVTERELRAELADRDRSPRKSDRASRSSRRAEEGSRSPKKSDGRGLSPEKPEDDAIRPPRQSHRRSSSRLRHGSPGLEQRPSRHSYYQGDGYDDYTPRAVVHDGVDSPMVQDIPPRRKRRRRRSTASGLNIAAATPAEPYEAFIGSDPYWMTEADADEWDAEVGRRSDEKSDVLHNPAMSSKRRSKWIIWGLVIMLVIGAIVGAVVGAVVAKEHSSSNKAKSSSGSGSNTSSSSTVDDGSLFDIQSTQVQDLLNNSALHKVFPGMDYTPLNAQYPGCLTVPPDQNNVTLDMAMLSQLTPAVRLYGTDCNQTEMVLEAISRLEMNNTLQVWLGVWLENNQTTNTRQLAQMYDILDTYPSSHFAGVIVGNEVLFREDLTETELADILTGVRTNLTSRSISIPVATSDLGDNWTAELANSSDIVMANVHPFFAGVTPDVAPGWTWSFWQTHDSDLATAGSSAYPASIISEVGWPSSGGNDCGTDAACANATAGAVASVDNMNTFLDGFVCESMTNATTYFWFEAFDEPWKVEFNTATDQWESKWGLMDSNRNVKDGLKIPSCDGKTIDKPY